MHENKLEIYDFEHSNRKPTDFEMKAHVDYIIRGFQERYSEAMDKLNEADGEADICGTAYQEALNYMASEDWKTLSEHAEEYGCWDATVDPEYFGVKDEPTEGGDE